MSGVTDRVSRALVLRRVDYGEADLVVNLLTADYGKRTVFARSARKSKRRFGGALEPFRVVEVRYQERDPNALAQLLSATVEESFDALTTDLHRLYWASLVLEWTGAMSVEGEPSPVFDTTIELFRWLGRESRGPWYNEAGCLRYALVLLAHAGYLPSLSHCVRTGAGLETIDHPHFSFHAGGLLADSVLLPEDHGQPVSRAALAFLAELCEGRFPQERDTEVLREARGLVVGVFRAILDAEPRSMALLRTVWI